MTDNKSDQLKKIRNRITETDDKMAELFRQRMELVRQVGEYKKENALPVYDPERERQVLMMGADRIEDPNIRAHYMNFLESVMAIARRYQGTILEGLKVAYSGTEGAFAHIAACRIFPTARKIAYNGFKKAYEAVESGECDCAVLPVENSFAGDVDQVNDLMFSGTLFINGMYDLAVTHDLLGLEGATIKDIRTVVSHPQALSQCAAFIEDHGLKQADYSNTALAAEHVKEQNDKSIAAIGSAESAKLFGLDVIARSINDDRTNTTRFAVFSRADTRDANHEGKPYFSLLFTVRDEAGSLAQALNIIGSHGFNMRTLRSRPMKELLWHYYFYVEAGGDIYGQEGQECFKELQSCCDKIKIVGSYTNLHDQETER